MVSLEARTGEKQRERRAKRADKNGSHGQKKCAATGGDGHYCIWALCLNNKNRRSHPWRDFRIGRDPQRLEKLERSNTVHGLWCGEGVSLTLRRETSDDDRDAVSIR